MVRESVRHAIETIAERLRHLFRCGVLRRRRQVEDHPQVQPIRENGRDLFDASAKASRVTKSSEKHL